MQMQDEAIMKEKKDRGIYILSNAAAHGFEQPVHTQANSAANPATATAANPTACLSAPDEAATEVAAALALLATLVAATALALDGELLAVVDVLFFFVLVVDPEAEPDAAVAVAPDAAAAVAVAEVRTGIVDAPAGRPDEVTTTPVAKGTSLPGAVGAANWTERVPAIHWA